MASFEQYRTETLASGNATLSALPAKIAAIHGMANSLFAHSLPSARAAFRAG
jgi:hypothetical protein